MLKLVLQEIEAFPARTVFVAALFLSVVSFQIFSGAAHHPVPVPRPVKEATVAATKIKDAKPVPLATGNFMDFSRAFKFLAKAPEAPSEDRQAAPATPLSYADARLYREIFSLQSDGKMADADALIRRVSDRRLMGHVLYQRYTHPTAYKSRFEELKAWMDQYAAQPGADRIYKMASARMPKGFTGRLKKPREKDMMRYGSIATVAAGHIYESRRPRTDAQQSAAVKISRDVNAMVRAQNMDGALNHLKSKSGILDTIEYDTLRGQIAAGYLYQRKMDKAYTLAVSAAHRSNVSVPMAGWVAGLVAFEGKRYKEAAKFFEMTARSKYASGWMSAAGSYWAARAHKRSGHLSRANHWLDAAADHPRTFYGLLATQALGRDFDFNWQVPAFTSAAYNVLAATPQGSRAIALVAAGQEGRAENELLRIDTSENENLREAVLSYASYANLPGLAMKMGGAMESGDEGQMYDAALYPVGPWEPNNGFTIDPALLNAIARQESRFDPQAESSQGALGLMQIMPQTARGVTKDFKTSESEKTYRLKDPQTNLEIAQQYIQTLLKDRNVDGDILKLLVAYNAGPGNLSRWEKQWDNVADPLLFIELIPSGETRNYVEKVISNYWMYRLREGRDIPTLEALAEGRPAKYAGDFERSIFQVAAR
jgi:soluble lytic murein transglycosylase